MVNDMAVQDWHDSDPGVIRGGNWSDWVHIATNQKEGVKGSRPLAGVQLTRSAGKCYRGYWRY